jgi:WS/DGAT/MGAT family acyltransferase
MSRHSMPAADAAWLHMDRPTNLMVINSVMTLDAPVSLDVLRETFVERIVGPFPRFSQRVLERGPLQGPAWEDDPTFDPRLHFHRVALPEPRDRRALQELVSDLVSAPLDRSRPLWNVFLVDGYGDGCAVVTRMHHCIADGIALARVMLLLTDEPEKASQGFTDGRRAGEHLGGAAAVLSPLARAAGTARDVAGALVHEGLETAVHPSHATELAGLAADDARTLGKLLLAGSEHRSALRGDLRVAHRVAWSDPVALWRVKRAGRAFDATINDVLVSAVAGSIGDYLRARGQEAGDARWSLPGELHALVPFNLRPLDEPLPRDLGNRFGLILLELPIGIDDDVDRLLTVKEGMDAIKASHEGAIAYGILGLMGRTPAAVERRLVDFFTSKATMVLTNVPGPRRRVSVAGVGLDSVLVWAPCSGSLGMSVAIFSYAGKVSVGFLADAGLVPDPDPLAAGFRRRVLDVARLA